MFLKSNTRRKGETYYHYFLGENGRLKTKHRHLVKSQDKYNLPQPKSSKNDTKALESYNDSNKKYTEFINTTTSNTTIMGVSPTFVGLQDPDAVEILTRTSPVTAILAITGIFAFITLCVTIAIIVFCKKKNTVFALQVCEEESDPAYEMDDFNTEIELSDGEYETQTRQIRRSQTDPLLSESARREFDECFKSRFIGSTDKFISKSKTFSGAHLPLCDSSSSSIDDNHQSKPSQSKTLSENGLETPKENQRSSSQERDKQIFSEEVYHDALYLTNTDVLDLPKLERFTNDVSSNDFNENDSVNFSDFRTFNECDFPSENTEPLINTQGYRQDVERQTRDSLHYQYQPLVVNAETEVPCCSDIAHSHSHTDEIDC